MHDWIRVRHSDVGHWPHSRIVYTLIRLVLSLLLVSMPAQAQTDSLAGKLDTLVTTRFARTKCPGLSVVVASENTIIFSKAIGVADIEQGIPLTADSVHRLASISKPITGTIIVDLVEHGKLSLDASIRQYLPELPAAYEKVTLRQLLSHQSGVRGYINPEDIAFSTAHYATSREAMKTFMGYPLVFAPRTKTEYSSLSFTVVGAAAEAVTGHSFQQLSAEFFAKHDISGFALDDPLAIVPKRVRGYLVAPKSTITFTDGRVVNRDYLAGTTDEITNAREYDISNRYPAGGFDSSGEDLLRFVIAVASGKVVKPETVQKMWTAQTTSDGAKSVFGLGWGVGQREGHSMVGMNGAEPSATTFLRYFPESGIGVTLLCNAEGAQGLDKLLDDVLRITLQ